MRTAVALFACALIACVRAVAPFADADTPGDDRGATDGRDARSRSDAASNDRPDVSSVDSRLDSSDLDAGFERCGLLGLACDPFDNRGCADRTSCRLSRGGAGNVWRADCLPNATSVNGTPCASAADCGLGYVCEHDSPTASHCRPLCCIGDIVEGVDRCRAAMRAPCERVRNFCVTAFGAGMLAVCEEEGPCDPFRRETCRVGQHCVPLGPGGIVGCQWFGSVPIGGVCTTLTDCGAGGLCVRDASASAGRCAALCDPTAPIGPDAGTCPGDDLRRCAGTSRCAALTAFPSLGACIP